MESVQACPPVCRQTGDEAGLAGASRVHGSIPAKRFNRLPGDGPGFRVSIQQIWAARCRPGRPVDWILQKRDTRPGARRPGPSWMNPADRCLRDVAARWRSRTDADGDSPASSIDRWTRTAMRKRPSTAPPPFGGLPRIPLFGRAGRWDAAPFGRPACFSVWGWLSRRRGGREPAACSSP